MKSMTRRSLLATAGAPALLRSAGTPRPNLVFIIADDHRWDMLGEAGNRIIRTPNLDEIARDGVHFTNNFCSSSVCQTSRATFLSGLYEQAHKVVDDDDTMPAAVFDQTFPALLKRSGYRTGFIGKWHFGRTKPLPKEKMWDTWDGFWGQGVYQQTENGKPIHLTDLQGEQAIRWLKTCSPRQPFLLWLALKAPHAQETGRPYHGEFANAREYDHLYTDVDIPYPKSGAEEYFKRLPDFIQHSELRVRWQDLFSTHERFQHSLKGYYRLITGVDTVVSRIRNSLHDLKFADNTVIVYAGDNGYFFAEHGLADKSIMLEESIRIPMLLHDPRMSRSLRGQRVREMSLNVDLAPTMLELAGVERPRSMQGHSLVPLIAKKAANWRREWFYQHNYGYDGSIPKSEGIRTADWKYIRYAGRNPLYEQLFHLAEDPQELNDLARSPGQGSQLDAMRARWRKWHDAVASWNTATEWRDPQ